MKYFSKEYLEIIKKMSNSSLSHDEIEEKIVDNIVMNYIESGVMVGEYVEMVS